MRAAARLPGHAPRSARDLACAWDELQAIADDLGKVALLAPDQERIDGAEFARMFASAGADRRECAQQAIDDMVRMLASGMQALSTIEAQRQDPSVAALALWREFREARAALRALLAPVDASPG